MGFGPGGLGWPNSVLEVRREGLNLQGMSGNPVWSLLS